MVWVVSIPSSPLSLSKIFLESVFVVAILNLTGVVNLTFSAAKYLKYRGFQFGQVVHPGYTVHTLYRWVRGGASILFV
jgi:hypothetical protein